MPLNALLPQRRFNIYARFEITLLMNGRSFTKNVVNRTPNPRNMVLPVSGQTTCALTRMNLSSAMSTIRKLLSRFGCFEQRTNAPPRLIFFALPSIRPLGVIITTGHLILTLRYWRSSFSGAICLSL